MSDKTREALEACPFCGSEGQTLLRGVRYPEGSADKEGAVMCPTCEARAPLKAWNMRPPTPSRPVTAGREDCLAALAKYRTECADRLYAAQKENPNDNVGIQVEAARVKAARKALSIATEALGPAVTPQDGWIDPDYILPRDVLVIGDGSLQNPYQTIVKGCKLSTLLAALAPNGAA